MNKLLDIRIWTTRVAKAREEAHRLLAQHEHATSRVIILEQLINQLSGLPVGVRDYFREAASCLEYNVLRAAIVMAWAGHFHAFSEALYGKYEKSIRSIRPKWKFRNLTELKDQIAEAQILDVGKEVGFITKAQLRVLQGQLSTRNQCAHPTLYRPSLNSAIGYVDEMINQSIKHVSHIEGRDDNR